MLRVPGSQADLFTLRSQGADVRVVYSPLDCLKIARANPENKKIVFFAIGFETTAPANAMLVWRAREEGLKNVSVLVSHVLVPPAIAAILSSPGNRVQAFLGPGHVCAVKGFSEYEDLSAGFKVPIVITGFEPLDILEGVLMTVRQLEEGRGELENQYVRAVTRGGNRAAQELVERVFEVLRPEVAWRRLDPSKRLQAAGRVRRTRCGGNFWSAGRRHQGVFHLHQRRDSQRGPKASRLPSLRDPLYSAAPPRGHHGFVGRGLCGLLSLRPSSEQKGNPRGLTRRPCSVASRNHPWAAEDLSP